MGELASVVGQDLPRTAEHPHRSERRIHDHVDPNAGQDPTGQYHAGVVVDECRQKVVLIEVIVQDVALPGELECFRQEAFQTCRAFGRGVSSPSSTRMRWALVAEIDAEHLGQLLHPQTRVLVFDADDALDVLEPLRVNAMRPARFGPERGPTLAL